MPSLYERVPATKRCPYSTFSLGAKYSQLSRNSRLFLLGNAQHMSSTGAWFLYCLTNITAAPEMGHDHFTFGLVADTRRLRSIVISIDSQSEEAKADEGQTII